MFKSEPPPMPRKAQRLKVDPSSELCWSHPRVFHAFWDLQRNIFSLGISPQPHLLHKKSAYPTCLPYLHQHTQPSLPSALPTSPLAALLVAPLPRATAPPARSSRSSPFRAAKSRDLVEELGVVHQGTWSGESSKAATSQRKAGCVGF